MTTQTAIKRWWLEYTLGGGDKKAAFNRWMFALAWGAVGFLAIHSLDAFSEEYGIGRGAKWHHYFMATVAFFLGSAGIVRAHWHMGKSQWLKRWPLKGE